MHRDVALDFLRDISCVAVVLIHAIFPFWNSTSVVLSKVSDYIPGGGILPYREFVWYVCSLLDAIARFSVPFFIMISGALLIEKRNCQLDIWVKKYCILL